jgi:aspartate aminotransferase-like enzyme
MRSRRSEDIFAEGLDARLPSQKLAGLTRLGGETWFQFVPEKVLNPSRSHVSNGARPGGRVVDVAKFEVVKDQGFLIDGGYGKIKGTTFRLSNMGDETEGTMNQLYAALDSAMKQL